MAPKAIKSYEPVLGLKIFEKSTERWDPTKKCREEGGWGRLGGGGGEGRSGGASNQNSVYDEAEKRLIRVAFL